MFINKKYPVVQNPYLRGYMHIYDLLATVMSSIRPRKKEGPIKKILLRNPAALGDVLYTLRLVRAIKEKNPYVSIGLLIGSWALPFVENALDVDTIHIEDHWALNRRHISLKDKVICWRKTRKKALDEIKKEKYDLAVDLYYYYPSASFLFWQAGIPMRIGYDSHEGSSLYTKTVPWKNQDIHNLEYQANLFTDGTISLSDLAQTKAVMRFDTTDEQFLQKYALQPKKYIVISVGTGAPDREWPIDYWQELLFRLNYGINHNEIPQFIFVGAGKKEKGRIDILLNKLGNRGKSLCNQLTIPQLMQVIRNSRLFIGLESFAGHIAAMYKTPQVSIMHGATNQMQWQPFANPNCTVIRRNLSCSPCYFPSRCAYKNACMAIPVESVYKGVMKNLEETTHLL